MWTWTDFKPDELYHWGVIGMKWGVRRYQNPDGSLTPAGRKHIRKHPEKYSAEQVEKELNRVTNEKKLYDTAKALKENQRSGLGKAVVGKIGKLMGSIADKAIDKTVDAIFKEEEKTYRLTELVKDKPLTAKEVAQYSILANAADKAKNMPGFLAKSESEVKKETKEAKKEAKKEFKKQAKEEAKAAKEEAKAAKEEAKAAKKAEAAYQKVMRNSEQKSEMDKEDEKAMLRAKYDYWDQMRR